MWSRARKQLAALWQLTTPYFLTNDRAVLRFDSLFKWSIAERWIGCSLLILIIAIELGQVWLAVLLNHWNAQFYDALQSKDLGAFWRQLIVFSLIATAFVVTSVYQLYLNQWLQIRWRRWLTALYLGRWLEHGTHYRMRLRGDAADNPDQREDLALFIGRTLSLCLGVLSAVTTLISFGVILWGISSRVPLEFQGHTIAFSGYLVWIAAAFSLLASLGAHFIGRALTSLEFNRQRYEADLRFALVHLRENSEQVALLQGEAAENRMLQDRLSSVVTNWCAIMRRQKTLTFFTAGYNQVAVVLPFLIMAPHYFAGAILLGTLTQTAGAFGQVQSSLSLFVNSYAALAEWMAIVNRLSGFEDQIELAKETACGGAALQGNRVPCLLSLRDVSLTTPAGRPLLTSVSFDVKAGEAILLRGPSGTGKTTLSPAIIGIWPYFSGRIDIRPGARLLALPQKPYIPLGSLRTGLTYPADDRAVPEYELRKALEKVGLKAGLPSLETSARWSDILSLGEQQRVAIARALLAKPDVVLLDEATSALEEGAEARLIRVLKTELPSAAIISIGHRASLVALHDRVIDLGSVGGRAVLAAVSGCC